MATLGQGDIKYVTFEDLKPIHRVAGLWVVTLRSSSDILQVPGADAAAAVSTTVSVTSGFYVSDGETLLTLTGGSAGTEAVIATLHREGLSNNLSLDRRKSGI